MKIEIPDKILNNTIEAMVDYQRRLEIETASLAGFDHPVAQYLAGCRAEAAKIAAELADFYLGL